jgi:hypothetical protein
MRTRRERVADALQRLQSLQGGVTPHHFPPHTVSTREANWWKLPYGVITSPMWLNIADEARSTPAVAVALYLHLRESAEQWRFRGKIRNPAGYLPCDTGGFCRVSDNEIARLCRVMDTRGLFDGDDEMRDLAECWITPVDGEENDDDDDDDCAGSFSFATGFECTSAQFDRQPRRPPAAPPARSPAANSPSAHALAQRRYRARQKAKKAAAQPITGDAADVTRDGSTITQVITRDGPVITGDVSPAPTS